MKKDDKTVTMCQKTRTNAHNETIVEHFQKTCYHNAHQDAFNKCTDNKEN